MAAAADTPTPLESVGVYCIRNSYLKNPGLLHTIVGTNIDASNIQAKYDSTIINARARPFATVYKKLSEELCRYAVSDGYMSGHDSIQYSHIFFAIGPSSIEPPTKLKADGSFQEVHSQIYGIATVIQKTADSSYLDFICTNAAIRGLGTPFLQCVIETIRSSTDSKYLYLDAIGYTISSSSRKETELEGLAKASKTSANFSEDARASRVALIDAAEKEETTRKPKAFPEAMNKFSKLIRFYQSNGFLLTAPKDPYDTDVIGEEPPLIVTEPRESYVRQRFSFLARLSMELR